METDLLSKARKYVQEGEYEKAQIVLQRLLRNDPKDAEALDLLGDLVLELGKIDEAVQDYENATDSYAKNQQYAEAIICLEKILKIDRANNDVLSRITDLYRFYGLPNRAVDTILDLCAWALDNKDNVVFVSGLRKIVEIQPKNLALRLSFVKVLYAIERVKEAEDELKKLKSLAEEAGDEETLEQVDKLLPQPDGGDELDPKSRLELANLLYDIGSKDEALIEFEKAASDFIENGESGEALNVLRRIIEIDPDHKDAAKKIDEVEAAMLAEELADIGADKEAAASETAAEEPVEELRLETVEEILAEDTTESKAEESALDAVQPDEIEEGLDFLELLEPEAVQETPAQAEQDVETYEDLDLGTDIEGFVAATGASAKEESGLADLEQDMEKMETEEPGVPEDKVADIEDFVAATDASAKEESGLADLEQDMEKMETEEPGVPEDKVAEEESVLADLEQDMEKMETEELAALEGKIADIEYLLGETEVPTLPRFEAVREFEGFRNTVVRQEVDVKKRLKLAKMAFDAGLYETAMNYVEDIKDRKETLPFSLEIEAGSLVKLLRYDEARNIIAPLLLSEDIPEDKKIELRYLLALAYEGVGDFDNSLKEIERILSIDPNYRDVKEMYVLMGGKGFVGEEPEAAFEEEPAVKSEAPLEPSKPTVQPVQIIEPEPTQVKEGVYPERVKERPVTVPEAVEEEPPLHPFEPPVQPVEITPALAKEKPPEQDVHPEAVEEKPVVSPEAPATLRKEILTIEKTTGDNIAFL